MDGEERERAMLEEQIARAKAAQAEAEKDAPATGLQKADGEKITLSLAPVPPISLSASGNGPATADNAEAGPSKPTAQSAPTTISFGSIGRPAAAAAKPISINPLKRPAPMNVFKAASKAPKAERSGGDEAEGGQGPSKKVYMSEAERLMKEDQARKAMRGGGSGPGGGQSYGGYGPRRADGPRKSNF